MDRSNYDRQLTKWSKNHYWDSLEPEIVVSPFPLHDIKN